MGMIKRWRLGLLLFALFLLGCGGQLDVLTPTTLPPTSVKPTVTPIQAQASGVGLAFYREWENQNYAGMYGMLTEDIQRLIDEEAFIDLYRSTMEEVFVTGVKTQPLAATQSPNSADATLTVRVTWQTAILGDIVREHNMPLRFVNERWGVVWNEGLIFPEMVGGNTLQLSVMHPVRGNLYDRGELLLASQGKAVIVGVVPALLQDEEGFLQIVASILGKSADALYATYSENNPQWFTPLGLTNVETIQENYLQLRPYFQHGMEVREMQGRIYSDSEVAPHLLGSVGPISAEQWEHYRAQGYAIDDRVGLTGLEAIAERYLAGKRGGQLALYNPAGEKVRVLQEAELFSGRNVHATFDGQFQKAVQTALAEAITTHPNGSAGSIVVLDVHSGKVRAIASYPSFSATAFSETSTTRDQEIEALFTDPRNPLLNRGVQGAYPPGSTFKIITMSAALHSGLYSGDSPLYCGGEWSKLGETNKKFDWLQGGHGNITLLQALTRSCNIYSYELGFGMDNNDPMFLPNMARAFGLGEQSGLDSAESAGLVPDPNWKVAQLGENWSPGDAVNMAIGQGFVLATPLQIANMTAAVANGGTLYRPSLIERVEGSLSTPEETPAPLVLKQLPLSAEHLQAIQRALYDVTSSPIGTATDKMAGLAITTAGKTGTAQTGGESTLPHSWFTGYAPFEQPEIAITVMIENVGEGSAVAAPIFRRIIELYYNQPITPYPWINN